MNSASILTALFNGAWQGALLCGAAYVAFRFARTLNATTMFTVWSVLLGICLALPVANALFSSRPYVRITVQTEQTLPAAATAPRHFSQRAVDAEKPSMQPTAPEAVIAAPSLRDRLFDAGSAVLQRAKLLLILLAAIAVVRLALLAREIVAMIVARRRSRPIAPPVSAHLSINRPFAFAASDSLTSPCVLGFSPALIVIPEQILDAPERELLSIILHEAEHVRRYDDVQNLLHRLVWAIAFFCPGVRIALRQLALFREQICDDAAVNGVGDPVAYAMTLTGMAQWAQGRGVPVPSFIFKRKQLLHRLDMLLDRAANHSLRINRTFAGSAALVLVLAAAIVLRVQVPVIAQVMVEPKAALAPVKPKIALAAAPPLKAQARPAAKPAPTAKPAAKPHVAAHPVKRVEHARVRVHAHEAHLLQLHQRTAVRVETTAATAVVVANSAQMSATAATVAASAAVAAAPPHSPAPTAPGHEHGSDALLSALESIGMRNLSVDELIALRDHGVSAPLITEAHAFFGSALTPGCLVGLSDHGISPLYLMSLRSVGLAGTAPESVIRLRDHGVDAAYVQRVRSYNSRAGIDDIIRLHDSGF